MPVEKSLFTPKPKPQPAPASVQQPQAAPTTPLTPAPVATTPVVPASPPVSTNHTTLLIGAAAAGVIAVVLTLGCVWYVFRGLDRSDSVFVSLGQDYATQGLAVGHAASLDEAANLIEKGSPLKDAFGKAHADFEASRVKDWGKSIKPRLEAIIPTETAEGNISADQRSSLVRALRSIARGERGDR